MHFCNTKYMGCEFANDYGYCSITACLKHQQQNKTYTIRPCTTIGTFFYCECGNEMYSVGNALRYNNKECPKCHAILKIKDGELKKWGLESEEQQ